MGEDRVKVGFIDWLVNANTCPDCYRSDYHNDSLHDHNHDPDILHDIRRTHLHDGYDGAHGHAIRIRQWQRQLTLQENILCFSLIDPSPFKLMDTLQAN